MLLIKSSKTLVLLSLLISLSAALSAWSITDTYFGNKITNLDARSYAMGGAGVFNDQRPFGISVNPANLTLMKKQIGIQGAAFVIRNEDNRSLPLYNSFDNYIDDAVYASNINSYDDYASAGFSALSFGDLRIGLGAYFKPLLSFDGNYVEEIRNNRNTDNDVYPEKIAQNMIENSGVLNQSAGVLSFGFGLGEIADINLGVDYAKLNGSSTMLKTIRWSQWAANVTGPNILPAYTQTVETDLNGSQLKVGTGIRVNNRFGFAVTQTFMATLDRTGFNRIQREAYRNTLAIDTTVVIGEDYILPSEIRVGFLYQPRNIMRTWFNFDVEFVKWSDISSHYDDVVNFYAGVEHHVENRLPLRLGFQAQHNYFYNEEADGSIIVKKVLSPMITAGSSFPLTKSLTIDLGFGYSWREYEALDMFKDTYYNDKLYTGNSTYVLWPNQYIVLRDRGWENPDKVKENNVSFNSSITFTW
ncbi:MAG: hypothetical protein Q8M98_05580 [Candidatus Cloacimonadaceae bacterium]|nr:hypothetical protein [Candidatus Cloacimonadaceae bacterium]MDP3114232.1 hypothetical protein [Candidatus Cloacimonadaceae bacterium]